MTKSLLQYQQLCQWKDHVGRHSNIYVSDTRTGCGCKHFSKCALQQDGKGAKKLFHHVKDDGMTGSVNRYWLEAESSSHKVGGSQVESKEEKLDALKRGKATAAVIGTKDMSTRFNVLMTIQVPLKQQEYRQLCEKECAYVCSGPAGGYGGFYERKAQAATLSGSHGKSSAARVSRGSFHDSWSGLTVQLPKRHPSEHITATIVMYYTCSGGTPTTEDVRAAIDDLEQLYRSIEVNGKLGDKEFDFMKSELSAKDVLDIQTKVETQPPPPTPFPSAPLNATQFPH